MSHNRIIDAASIREDANSLALRASNRAEAVAGWIKHQRAALREKIRVELKPRRCRQVHHKAAGGLMNIRLHSRQSRRTEILLCVTAIAVHTFGREPAIEVIAIADQEAAVLRAPLGCALPRRVLGEKSCPLQTDLRTRFLRPRAGPEQESNA